MAAFPILPRLDPTCLPRPGDLARAERGFERLAERMSELTESDKPEDKLAARFLTGFLEDQNGRALLAAVFGNSPFLTLCLLRAPDVLHALFLSGPDAAFSALRADMIAKGGPETDTAKLMTLLRDSKRRAALLIGLADIAGFWNLVQVTGALSDLAETALDLAVGHLLRQASTRGEFALPHPEAPCQDSGFTVIGMGKLGARELNYSSDIDLIILYDSEKIAYTGSRSLPECMVRITRELVRIMDERTADGYVFRTDLRLRPDPGSTPAALSVEAAETYYEAFGQNWERAAMIKARAVAGDRTVGTLFLKNLRPYVWRKNLDFAAIQDIHSIKRQINAHRGGAQIAVAGHNIKLGRGGIREIEFFAQTQQLIWGGRQPELRDSRTIPTLESLAQAEHIAQAAKDDLIAAYDYLRRLEHRLQMIDDKQTQTLPTEPERLTELAAFMAHADLAAMDATLRGHLQKVETHYAALFEDAPDLSTPGGSLVFTGSENDPETLKTISALGFTNAEAVCSTIRGWHHGRVRATRSTRARELLTELTPALLHALARTSQPDAAFMKFDDFLKRMPAGVQLFSLFYANASLLDLVAEIMGNAPRLAEQLTRNPALVDGMLTQGFLEALPEKAEWKADLDQQIEHARDSAEDLENLTQAIVRWTNDRRFQIGVQILLRRLTPEGAGVAFANLADTALESLFTEVAADFARAHGTFPDAQAVLVALGKMGGREMTATSDLDLILIYDVDPEAESSDGKRPLPPATYYARLTQRLVNALTAPTADGRLYEVDLRLRPSGRSGPLATGLAAFVKYQESEAWTWEHMALTRARIVCGETGLAANVRDAITTTLCKERDLAKLLQDVAEMRRRMAQEHKGQSEWDIKHRRGGLVDIEFLTQYLELAHAARHPGALDTNTGIALTKLAAVGALAQDRVQILQEALSLWSAIQGVLRITIEGAFSETTAPEGLKLLMAESAGCANFAELKQRMDASAQTVRQIFTDMIDTPAQTCAPQKEPSP